MKLILATLCALSLGGVKAYAADEEVPETPGTRLVQPQVKITPTNKTGRVELKTGKTEATSGGSKTDVRIGDVKANAHVGDVKSSSNPTINVYVDTRSASGGGAATCTGVICRPAPARRIASAPPPPRSRGLACCPPGMNIPGLPPCRPPRPGYAMPLGNGRCMLSGPYQGTMGYEGPDRRCHLRPVPQWGGAMQTSYYGRDP